MTRAVHRGLGFSGQVSVAMVGGCFRQDELRSAFVEGPQTDSSPGCRRVSFARSKVGAALLAREVAKCR